MTVSGKAPHMTNEQRDLEGTVIALTGAGSGIGAVTARLLLEAGASLVAADLHADRLDSLVEEYGERVHPIAGDVGDPETSRRIATAAIEVFGRLDSVVANAGVGYFVGVNDYDETRIRTMVDTNVLGTVWLARAAVAAYRAAGNGGDIIVIRSVAGLGAGGGTESVYSATKAAQIQFATSLDREVRSEGIRVSVIAPAAVNTSFAVATGRFGDRPPEDGDFLRPDDIAGAIVTTLRQPRRMRTSLWSMWSLAEANG